VFEYTLCCVVLCAVDDFNRVELQTDSPNENNFINASYIKVNTSCLELYGNNWIIVFDCRVCNYSLFVCLLLNGTLALFMLILVSFSKYIRYLCVTLDSNLKFDQRIIALFKSCSFSLSVSFAWFCFTRWIDHYADRCRYL